MPKKRMKRHAVDQPLDKPYRLIPLTQGQNAIVDATDFEWLSKFNWCTRRGKGANTLYAGRRVPGGPVIFMHKVILGCKRGQEGDHKNRNALDNRRQNLRKATRWQNQRNRELQTNNTSGYRGVSWNKTENKWEAYISLRGRKIGLGYFHDLLEAAHAYDDAAKQHYGEFGQFNFQ